MTDGTTPVELRAELERLVLTDLLGPSDPHELLPAIRTPVGPRPGIASLVGGAPSLEGSSARRSTCVPTLDRSVES